MTIIGFCKEIPYFHNEFSLKEEEYERFRLLSELLTKTEEYIISINLDSILLIESLSITAVVLTFNAAACFSKFFSEAFWSSLAADSIVFP